MIIFYKELLKTKDLKRNRNSKANIIIIKVSYLYPIDDIPEIRKI